MFHFLPPHPEARLLLNVLAESLLIKSTTGSGGDYTMVRRSGLILPPFEKRKN